MKSGIALRLREDRTIASEATEKAEELKWFFTSAFTKEDYSTIPAPKDEQLQEVLKHIMS